MGAVEGIKTALEALKVMQDLAGAAQNVELNRKVAESYVAVAGAYAEAIDLREDNLRLKRELEKVSDRSAMRAALMRDADVYYFERPPAGYHEGPYCAQCLDDEGKLITLRFQSLNGAETMAQWYCGKCKGYADSAAARRKA